MIVQKIAQLRTQVPRSVSQIRATRTRSAAHQICQIATKPSANIRKSTIRANASASALTAFLASGTISAPMIAPVTRPPNGPTSTNNRA